MNPLWKGIENIYNFRVNGLTKFGTQDQQNAIDLLLCELADTEQNCCNLDFVI
jgi:hypothetical protein